MRASVLIAVFITATGTAAARPGGIVVPPAEIDFGVGTPIGNTDVTASTEFRAGIHWASLYWKPTALDIGAGYAGSWRGVEPRYIARQTGGGYIEDETLRLHGVYMQLGYAIENERNWRTWVGGRVEAFTGKLNYQDITVLGGALRIATEFYLNSIKSAGGRGLGFYAGTWALGVYVEGIYRSLPVELGPVGVSAGVTARIPFIVAIGV